MSFVEWKFKHTPYSSSGYDDNDTTTIEVREPNLQVALGDNKDQFQFKVTNVFGDYNAFFNPRDRLEIFRSYNSPVSEVTDLIMVGSVIDSPNDVSATGNLITVKGNNYSEIVTNGITFADPGTAELTIPEALQQALIILNLNSPNFAITWSSSNPDVKSDGDPFPVINERVFYKPYRQLIEKYSTNQFTEDGNYFWYVNKDNELIWDKRTTSVDHTFVAQTDAHETLKIGKDTKDVKNFVIIKGGLDPKGRQIQTRAQDFSSSARHGIRFKMLVDENKYAKEVNVRDMTKAGGNEEDGTLPSSISGFSYPFETTFIDPATGSLAIVTDDDDYVDALRRHVKNYLELIAREYIENNKYGKLQVDITFKAGTKDWGLGDLVSTDIPNLLNSAEQGTKLMRVSAINYTTTTDRYSLVEDIGTL